MIVDFEIEYDNILISTSKPLLDVAFVPHYLSTKCYWCLNIPKATVETSIKNSICFGVYEDNKQIGFARVISDCVSFAYLADVFIVKKKQGKGLGTLLIKTIHQHPALQGLRRWMLATRDAHNLYKKFNWTSLDETAQQRLMQRLNQNVYNKN